MKKTRKDPMRRCVGCMESKPKKELVRIVATPENQLKLDFSGKANGRGVYLCPTNQCISMAKKKKAVSRELEREIDPLELEKIFEELAIYERENP